MTLETLDLLVLALALCAPPAIAFYGARAPQGDITLSRNLVCQIMLMGVSGIGMWIMLGPLAFPTTALGLGLPDWGTFAWGAGIAAVFILGIGPILMRLPGWLGLSGFEGTLGTLARLPVWYLALAVVIGGIAEEVLYRGIAIAILSDRDFGPWSAGLIVLLAYTLAHIPMWGIGPALTTAISGAFLMVFYLWHGDLIANIIGHIATDFVGIVLGPLLARRRTARGD